VLILVTKQVMEKAVIFELDARRIVIVLIQV
jgi:hypothetical protein